ncbi:HSP20 family protein [Chryseobacterium ginsenosidimutans]|uniref:Hsp20/alpha crystallin family protein n=1 Tax=Chryseobacterium ginsenosidimutans TaxID=687846 RepID=UPI000E36DA05|nr:Hsp20/alpha crystallin family protein [Chryseobacterium ginsenosidimutans]MDR6697945.1 HSP20 family protein [Chryseobacterium ginsenosidimutans]
MEYEPFKCKRIVVHNIIDKNGVYKIKVSAPGFKKKDFKVSVEDGSLIISAETGAEKKEEKENYVRKEFSASSFVRSFRLPDSISLGHIKANYKGGLLNITISKTNLDKKEVKEIKIR